MSALSFCLQGKRTGWVYITVFFLLSWWVYVPVHELMHAFGCILAGGSVGRLDLAPLYGAELLEKVFPFIHSGSEYAGQLKEFDTGGSDIVYLVTVFSPYLLTVFPGVPLIRRVHASKSPLRGSIKLGLAMPFAFAPFVSMTGDFYETGSIVTTRLASEITSGLDVSRWRSDDLFKLLKGLKDGFTAMDFPIILISFLIGVCLAFLTYNAGRVPVRLIKKVEKPPAP